MKTFFKGIVIAGVLLIMFNVIPQFVKAQDGGPDPGDDPDAPIDGGVTLLLATGIGYGIKKYRDNQKKNTRF